MRKPILGKQTFLKENTERGKAFEKYYKEIYERVKDKSPLFTGRYLVVNTKENSLDSAQKIFKDKLNFKIANSRDFIHEGLNEESFSDADALIYDELGIALIDGNEKQLQILESASRDFIIQPEKIVYVPDDIPERISTPATWGINVTRVLDSSYTGKDVKIAVLDTGFDAKHPDFLNRKIVSKSFVPNETCQDMHGHGTHCIGTACGNMDDQNFRYGVAKNANIYAGKVLSNEGSGAQSWILNGIAWAVNNNCKVISMSLGSRIYPGEGYDLAYEKAAKFALSKGAITVAAAGNDSRRSFSQFIPVSSPANCPSVLAVGALDSSLNVADFSNRSINPEGQIDIAAPGVAIYSSWTMPTRNRTISGTSMATPHVAGIIGLLCEKFPEATIYEIKEELRNIARRLPLPSIDVGVGLAIAP